MSKILLPIILFQFIFGQNLEYSNTSPMHILGTINKIDVPQKKDTTFNTEWVKELTLLLPCKNTKVPKRSTRLPNAARDYRNGTHRGIDFFANWGTEVRSVAKGFVIRADHNYNEYPADFRVKMLRSAGKVGHTPSDIFNNVLLGKAVFLDHGFDLVPGFRAITIYAHLSSIADGILPGTKVDKGQLIGFSGNTGTSSGSLRNEKGAHLHWELHFEDKSGKYFLGQNIPPELLKENIDLLFE